MVQVVVKDDKVVAICSDNEDLYDSFPHEPGWAYFDYYKPISLITSVSIPTTESFKTVNDNEENVVEFRDSTIQINTMGQVLDPRLEMSLSEIKNTIISQINRIIDHEIKAKYPPQTQTEIIMQIMGNNEKSLTVMRDFFNLKYARKKNQIEIVNKLTSIDDCISYNVWK